MNNPTSNTFTGLLTRFIADEQFRVGLARGEHKRFRAGLSDEESRQLDVILAVYASNRGSLKGLAFPVNTKLGTYLTARR